MTTITQTPRIIIREFLPEEEHLFVTLMDDARINAYLPKRDTEQLKKLFGDTLADYEAGIKLTRWGMFSTDDDAFMGLAILKVVADDPEKSELGYVLHLPYHGKGLATEMAVGLLQYGFDEMQLQEIFAVTDHVNIASQRVLEKAGMTRGDHMIRNGMELSFFKVTADAWKSLR